MAGRFILLVLTMCGALAPLQACAADNSGLPGGSMRGHLGARDLMNFCSGKFDIDYGFCAGYVSSISEAMLDHPLYGMEACNHGAVRSQQLLELVMTYLQEHPDRQSGPASVAVAETLASSFPCYQDAKPRFSLTQPSAR